MLNLWKIYKWKSCTVGVTYLHFDSLYPCVCVCVCVCVLAPSHSGAVGQSPATQISPIKEIETNIHHGPTGGRRATSGPISLVTRLAKFIVNLLLVATSSLTCLFRSIMWKIPLYLSRLLPYVQMPHMLLTLKPCRKI
jgi:hypothetical protein